MNGWPVRANAEGRLERCAQIVPGCLARKSVMACGMPYCEQDLEPLAKAVCAAGLRRDGQLVVSPAAPMGPPFRQCEGTTFGVSSVGTPMMTTA